MAPAGMKRPSRPLLNVSLNLSDVFEDEMHVGFTSSTGQLVQSHKILAWSFSNSNFSLSESLITTGLPSFVLPKDPFYRSTVFIAGATAGGVLLVVSGAATIWYQEIEAATKGFSEENVIGIGGNGKVYKGVLPGGTEVAVKRISHENDGTREFLAEISSLGRLKHRSLVGLRGWCKRDRGLFMLVYDYMENGSLEKRVFDCDENRLLSCEERIRILKDVPSTTRVVGTIGYMAPEVVRSGRATAQADVFSFGVLILEVMCGRRPTEEGKPTLVESVWQLRMQGKLLNAMDERLKARGDQFDEGEVERMLHLGLLCAYPDSKVRPTMRQVVKIMEGKKELNEIESEDMDACLLQQMKSKDLWSNYSQSSSHGSHPTFDEVRRYHSSLSLSWTNTMVEGR
ncbi:hypothetical protein OIU78_024682 [Salix suchowensis]|nr:hypothetical protein OIU78_024682 [Salix suchowensis]